VFYVQKLRILPLFIFFFASAFSPARLFYRDEKYYCDLNEIHKVARVTYLSALHTFFAVALVEASRFFHFTPERTKPG
jgi:hypothetical protein